MVDSVDSQPRPVARRRRRRRPVLIVVGVGLLYLIGQWFGFLGSALGDQGPEGGGEGQVAKAPGAEVGDRPSAGEVPGRELGPSQELAGKLPSAADADAPAAGTTPNQAAATTVSQPPSQASDEALLIAEEWMPEDRFQSLMSLLRLHVTDNALGSASAALQRLRTQKLSPVQTELVVAFTERLTPLRRTAEERILQHIQDGEVLLGNQLAAELVVDGAWSAQSLAAAAPKLAMNANWQLSLGLDGVVAPQSKPLARNRKVRVRWRDEFIEGVVAASRSDQVTVRVLAGSGQMFPTVKVVAAEPVNASADEAVEMGLAAVHAGASRLARLWLLRAHLLSTDLSPRGLQLAALLQ